MALFRHSFIIEGFAGWFWHPLSGAVGHNEPTPDPEPNPNPNSDPVPTPEPKPEGGESATGSATAKPQLPTTGDLAAMAAAVGSTGLAALAAAFLDRMRRRK